MKLLCLLTIILSTSYLSAQNKDIPTISVHPKEAVEDDNIIIVDDNAPIFIVTEQMPMFSDSSCYKLNTYQEQKACADRKLLNFIYTHINYPSTLRDQGIEASVVVSFIVETDGSLSSFEVLKGNDPPIFAEEFIRVLKLTLEKNGPWIPAQQRGTNVRLKYNLPCRLNLN